MRRDLGDGKGGLVDVLWGRDDAYESWTIGLITFEECSLTPRIGPVEIDQNVQSHRRLQHEELSPTMLPCLALEGALDVVNIRVRTLVFVLVLAYA